MLNTGGLITNAINVQERKGRNEDSETRTIPGSDSHWRLIEPLKFWKIPSCLESSMQLQGCEELQLIELGSHSLRTSYDSNRSPGMIGIQNQQTGKRSPGALLTLVMLIKGDRSVRCTCPWREHPFDGTGQDPLFSFPLLRNDLGPDAAAAGERTCPLGWEESEVSAPV
ncbi:hypothetical protein NPIL_152831 [Nephila pilipes]|uniref:Uncharacterized protein n=1 Tax=Nephila pilipes TaxID=299642 RepID=A0A8X6N2P5_NEPPI|nr:hypothetical protein NPIL_647021 [Nephila pilipes]GFT96624.1 hypothetical protein NPIL_152831 [Nephila pilipes]